MSTIQQLKNPVSVLQNFIKNNNLDIELLLQETDLFKINICYEKYKAAINKPTAQIIINYQDLIYKIGTYLKYNSTDIRRLTNEERETLEIPFKVVDGCSDIYTDLSKQLKKVLGMIPENQRIWAVLAFLIAIAGPWCYHEYLEYSQQQTESKILDNAINKLEESNKMLADIIKNYEKDTLTNLKEIDTEIKFQGNKFTSEDIQKIQRLRFPRQHHEKSAKILEGHFMVTQINIKQHYIIIENNENKVEKILYADDLISCMQDFKNQFKQAIDNEGKMFKIKAYYPEKNGKKGTMLLSEISPVN